MKLRWIEVLLILMAVPMLCFAKDKVKDKNNVEWEVVPEYYYINDKGKVKKNPLYKDYIKEEWSFDKIAKPDINETLLLTPDQSEEVRLALWNTGLVDKVNKKYKEGRKLIHKELKPAKNDYKNDKDRGTVYYNPEIGNPFDPTKKKARNYSFHKVIIPDGTIVEEEINFSQAEPHTDAIIGENLTFRRCNLVNVEIHPSWILDNSLSVHRRIVFKEVEGITYRCSEIEQQGVFNEIDCAEVYTE